MHLDSGQSADSTLSQTVQLLLPHELRYPSGHTIPFLISVTGVNLYEPDVQLVRVSVAQTRTGAVRETTVIARGRMQEDSQQGNVHQGATRPRRTMSGTIDTGEVGKEFSWGVDRVAVVSVSFFHYVTRTSHKILIKISKPV